jgi:hypothetical protein
VIRRKLERFTPDAWRAQVQGHIVEREPMPWLAAILIADLMDTNGECSPSLAEIASVMKASRSTAKRAVRRLEELGLLEVTVRKQKYSLHETNVYQATTPLPDSCPSCGRDGGWYDEMAGACGHCGEAA